MSIVSIETNAGKVATQLGMNQRQLRVVMERAMKESAREVRHDYERVTSTWTHKPHITEEVNTRAGRVEAMIGTDDEIFGYVDRGTKAHRIVARKAKALRFWSGFHPKTTPNALNVGGGGVFGNIIFRKGVWHPGTKARRFTRLFHRRSNKRTPKIVRKHFAKWVKRCGTR